MPIAKPLRANWPIYLVYPSPSPTPLRGFLFSTIRGNGASDWTINANQMTLTFSGKPSPRPLLLRNRMMLMHGRHLSLPTTTPRSAMVWDGTLPWGFHWIRPWNFPTLDGQSQRYISKKLNIQIGMNGPKGRCNANNTYPVCIPSKLAFKRTLIQFTPFPNFTRAAWLFKDSRTSAHPNATDPDAQDDRSGCSTRAEVTDAPIEPYSVDDILKGGCFIAEKNFEKILERLRTKKNLILQGPPGTGKTWLAKRLAFALMGQRDESKVRAVQF